MMMSPVGGVAQAGARKATPALIVGPLAADGADAQADTEGGITERVEGDFAGDELDEGHFENDGAGGFGGCIDDLEAMPWDLH